MHILISWIGKSDLHAAGVNDKDDIGPILRLLRDDRYVYHTVHLLNDFGSDFVDCRVGGDDDSIMVSCQQYVAWITSQLAKLKRTTKIAIHSTPPVVAQYGKAYHEANRVVEEIVRESIGGAEYDIALSSGQSAHIMALALTTQRLKPRILLAWQAKDSTYQVQCIKWPLSVSVDAVEPQSAVFVDLASVDGYSPHVAFENIIGDSRALMATKCLAERAAKSDAPILLIGETGTGKEEFASAIHEISPRKDEPFHAIHCGAIPEQLLESDLFGHELGAFSGATRMKRGRLEIVDGGTVLLDEIGDMPLSLQVKLLRFLQNGEFVRVGGIEERKADVRVIAATHRDLPRMVHDRLFRADLYHRLSVLPITIPPLRQRGGDKRQLADHFLKVHNDEAKRTPLVLTEEAYAEIARYHWPGNVREMDGAMCRLAYLLDKSQATVSAGHVRAVIEQEASYLPDRPLPDLTEREFITRLAGDLDELIRRFSRGAPRKLPVITVPSKRNRKKGKTDNLINWFLEPLLLARALVLAKENASEAGHLLGRGKLDTMRGDRFGLDAFRPYINESVLQGERSDV